MEAGAAPSVLGGARSPGRRRPTGVTAGLAVDRGGRAVRGVRVATQWVESGHTSGASAAIWLADRGSSVLVPCTLAVLLLLPDGKLPGPTRRPVASVAIGAQLALVVAWCLVSGPAASPDSSWPTDPANPVGVLPSGWSPTMDAMSSWLLQLPFLLGIAAVAARAPARRRVRRRLVDVLAAASVFTLLWSLAGHCGPRRGCARRGRLGPARGGADVGDASPPGARHRRGRAPRLRVRRADCPDRAGLHRRRGGGGGLGQDLPPTASAW